MQSLLQKVSFYLCLRPMNNEDKMIPSTVVTVHKRIHPIRSLAMTSEKPEARIRLEIGIEIGLNFDQSKQSSLNLRLDFFLLIG